MVTTTWNPNRNNATAFLLQEHSKIGSVRYADLEVAFQTTVGSCGFVYLSTSRNIQNIPLTILTTLRSKQYSLKQVIPLQVQSYQGYYLVSDIITYRHGLGATLEESLLDYKEDLTAYFESLLRNKGNLSTALEYDLKRLTEYIESQ